MKKLLALLAIVATLCGNASATTIDFSVPTGFTGGSVSGFTFSSNWRNYGYGGSDTPYMEWYNQDHWLSFDAGSFTFAGMSLAATPWDGYGYGNGTVNVDFKDAIGNVIASSSIVLGGGDGFNAFTQTVSGVHEIYFHATGGFWPRLESVNIADTAKVPEPGSIFMLLGGLGLMGFMSRRRKA
jgi:hypothetical protein